jgi:hypothetical protein
MTKKPIYTVLIQVMGYLCAIAKGVPYTGRLYFPKTVKGYNVWIHIHSETAKHITKLYPSVEHCTYPSENGEYIRSMMFQDKYDARQKNSILLTRTYGIRNNITLLERKTPDKKRPYFYLSGPNYSVVEFLKNIIQ